VAPDHGEIAFTSVCSDTHLRASLVAGCV
jgi:hypothetical protein